MCFGLMHIDLRIGIVHDGLGLFGIRNAVMRLIE